MVPFVWRLLETVGGVLESGGDTRDGVCEQSIVLEVTET